jgi:uncharacterized protein YxeA
MFIKTNIPETTPCFGGDLVDFGDKMFDQDEMILNDRANQIQAIISGNRCGHMPDAPRFFNPPDHHKQRPAILDRAIDAWEVVYRKAKKFFKKLATSHNNGRQVRSERREAIASISQVMLHYLELSTLRVGFYVGSKFVHLDQEYMAKKAGLSLSRAKRAIADLEEEGYVKITRQYKKKEDGTFEGEPSIREITVQFFIDLGMDVQKLFFARDHKRKKEEKAQAKNGLKKLKGMVQAVTSFSGNLLTSNRQQPPRYGSCDQPPLKQGAVIDKNLISQAIALHQADPSRSCSDYYKELMRQIE